MLKATATVGRPSKSNWKKEVGRVVMMLSLSLPPLMMGIYLREERISKFKSSLDLASVLAVCATTPRDREVGIWKCKKSENLLFFSIKTLY